MIEVQSPVKGIIGDRKEEEIQRRSHGYFHGDDVFGLLMSHDRCHMVEGAVGVPLGYKQVDCRTSWTRGTVSSSSRIQRDELVPLEFLDHLAAAVYCGSLPMGHFFWQGCTRELLAGCCTMLLAVTCFLLS